MKTTLGIAAVLLSLTGTAYAGSPYVGLGVLEGFADIPSFSGTFGGYPVSLSGDKKTDTGYTVFAGYNVTRYWGAEVGYNDLGSQYTIKGVFNGTPFKSGGIRAYNYYAALTGTLPLYQHFALHGKLGWVDNHIKASNVCVSGAGCVDVSSSSSHSDVLYGVGVSYAVTSQWLAQLDYANYGKMEKSDQGFDAIKGSSVSLSAKYCF